MELLGFRESSFVKKMFGMLPQSRMAAGAACKRVGQLVANSGLRRLGVSNVSSFESSIFDHSANNLSASISLISRYRHYECRQISQLVKSNGKRLFLVDTLALVISLSLFIAFSQYCCIFLLISEGRWSENLRISSARSLGVLVSDLIYFHPG